MTADEIALATLDVQRLQAWITGIAIFLGPLSGVLFTLWFQARKEKRDAKHRLFLTLMCDRKSMPPSTVAVKALNQIDVVFADSTSVKNIWHEYYALVHQPPAEPRMHKWLELLAAMANELGYRNLSPLDLDKFYIPQGHVDEAEFQRHTAQQWSRVLDNTERFVVIPLEKNEPRT